MVEAAASAYNHQTSGIHNPPTIIGRGRIRERVQNGTESQKPIDKRELAEQDNHQERPNESFPQPQAAQPGGRKPELKFGRTERNDVAIAKQRGLDRLIIDHDQGVLRGGEFETFPPVKFQRQMSIPRAIVIQLQVVPAGATDAKRKTADNRLAARLFSRQNVKFNHQKIRRGT